MNYFLDTEFIERPCTIDLISIGIVREDGKEYYGVNTECVCAAANEWVLENVLSKMPEYSASQRRLVGSTREQIRDDILRFVGDDTPRFWAYFADYDWVVFCWLFGAMIDLPKGWPMLCYDLRQYADSLGVAKIRIPQEDEHNALDDAKWNLRAYNELSSFANGKK
jgi:hypothetical protein